MSGTTGRPGPESGVSVPMAAGIRADSTAWGEPDQVATRAGDVPAPGEHHRRAVTGSVARLRGGASG
jgi:hypothetical protein